MFLSVIIPAYNEAALIGQSVSAARAIGDEVIVADGHSLDDTAARAAWAGARVVQARRGRGPQLDAGAAAARGDVLLFMHADSFLPAHARGAIEAALADRVVLGGNFRLVFEPASRYSRFYDWANHLRRCWLRIYYGDSGIFVRRSIFVALGGFGDLPLFEDYAFARRLERMGRTSYLRHVIIRSSARRFHDAPLRTLGLWVFLQAAFCLGVSPALLSSFYKAKRKSRG